MREELLDVFDDNRQKLGQASHAAVHRAGNWHRTIHCWLIERDSGRILYQRRSETKKLFPGKLDVSVAGHIRAGETPLAALAREGREELGVDVDTASAALIGIRRSVFTGAGIHNREFQHIYFAALPCALDGLEFKDGEVASVLLLRPEDVVALHERGSRAVGEAWDGFRHGTITVSREDFIESDDGYDLKIPTRVQEWLRGVQEFCDWK